MLSFAHFEVEFLIFPAVIVFLLMLLPIPVISRRVSKLIASIEKNVRIGGVSILLVITLLGLFLFALSFREYSNRFVLSDKGNANVDGGRSEKLEMDLHPRAEREFLAKKWRAERNMYIHALIAILYAALMKIARVTLENFALKAGSGAAAAAAPKDADGIKKKQE